MRDAGEFDFPDEIGTSAEPGWAVVPVRQVLQVAEYEPLAIAHDDLVVDGRLHLYEEVVGKKYFNVFMRRDQLVFQAGSYVGLIPVNERVTIDVRPRVPVRSLDRLLRMANAAPVALERALRGYPSTSEPLPSLLDVLADSLIAAVEVIVTNGLHREYRQVLGDTSFPRGRILVGDTVSRHLARGVEHRVAASWFEPTLDTGPNRCVRFALQHLARCYRGVPQNKETRARLRALNRLHRAFEVAELDVARRFLRDSLVQEPKKLPSIRWYYAHALILAKTIIHERGITFDGRETEIVVPSLLVNLADVFENYVRAVLRENYLRLAPDYEVLDGNHDPPRGGARSLFDSGTPSGRLTAASKATPDVVIRERSPATGVGEVRLVIEVKYKPIKELPDRDDLNQAVTYAAIYRSPVVVIVHPLVPGGRQGLVLLGRIDAISVFQYGLNLAAPSLPIEEAAFAAQLVALTSQFDAERAAG